MIKVDTYSGGEWTEPKTVKEEFGECLDYLSILKLLGPYFGGLEDRVISVAGFGKSRQDWKSAEQKQLRKQAGARLSPTVPAACRDKPSLEPAIADSQGRTAWAAPR